MKIRMKTSIGGTFHGDPDGVKAGDEVNIDQASALRYIANGYAEPATKSAERKADKAEVAAKIAEAEALDDYVPEVPEPTEVVGGPEEPTGDIELSDAGPVSVSEDVEDEGNVVHDEPKVLDEDVLDEVDPLRESEDEDSDDEDEGKHEKRAPRRPRRK